MKSDPEDSEELTGKAPSDCQARLAAAEHDMVKLAGHVKDGSHSNLLEI